MDRSRCPALVLVSHLRPLRPFCGTPLTKRLRHSFVVVKIMLGVQLLSYATRRRAGMEAREAADAVTNFGRNPIGEGKEEQAYNRELKTILDDTRDDATPVPDIGERRPGDDPGKGGKRKRLPLEEITRFTMVKRIW